MPDQTLTVTVPLPLFSGNRLTLNLQVSQAGGVAEVPPGSVGGDISSHNEIISWPGLAAALKFLVIRATMGDTRVDQKFKSNWAAARAVGVPHLGVYHLYIKEAGAVAQAEHIWRTTAGDWGNFQIVLDIETRAGEVIPPATWPVVSRSIAELIESCERLFGHTPLIYTSAYMWPQFVGPTLLPPLADILPRVGVFVADWSGPVSIPKPGWTTWDYHQRGKKPRTWATGDIDDDVRAPAPQRPLLDRILGVVGFKRA